MAVREVWKISDRERDNLAAELTYLVEFCDMESIPGGALGRREVGHIKARLMTMANTIASIEVTEVEREERDDERERLAGVRAGAKGRPTSGLARARGRVTATSRGARVPPPFEYDYSHAADIYQQAGSGLAYPTAPPPAPGNNANSIFAPDEGRIQQFEPSGWFSTGTFTWPSRERQGAGREQPVAVAESGGTETED